MGPAVHGAFGSALTVVQEHVMEASIDHGGREDPVLGATVEEKLRRRWSPQQIAGWLKLNYPNDPEMQALHESIYRTLFVQSRGALRRELTQYLGTGGVIRRPKGVRLPDGRGGRPNTLHMSERPAEAEDRAVPGHWEGD